MALPQRRSDPAPEPAHAEALESPAGRPALSDGAVLLLLAGLAVALRALAFPFTENLYGDSVVRTELAERWLAAPKLITSFNEGVFQFGPLHTYVNALFLALWHNRADAGRLASMVAGVLAIWPTWRVSHRLFGRTAAIWACAGFALWGMHIQMSTTAGSEALALCLFAFSIDGLLQGIEELRFGPMARSALFLNLACAVRYDMWMYIPLFGLAIALGSKDRIASGTRAVMFLGLASLFPLLWMEGNERAMGDALYPVHFIDQFHKQWTRDGVAWLGATRFRLWGLVFWPGTLLLTLSPFFGLCSLVGAGRALKTRENRLLVLLALVPTAYFTARTLLLTFSPLARFTVAQLWLCLPFTYAGFQLLTAKLPRAATIAVGALVALVAVATPVALAKVTYRVDDGWGNMLKPVSPVTTMPQDQMEVAHWLGASIPAPDALLVDYDDAYTDIGVAFFSNLPEERMVRLRWEDDKNVPIAQRIAKAAPRAVVLWKNGKLLQHPEAHREGDALTAYGLHFHKVKGFSNDKFEVFRAD